MPAPPKRPAQDSGEDATDVTGVRNSLSCPQCAKSFSRPENLNRHVKSHNPQRLHRCQVCDRTFTRSDLRRKHEATHQKLGRRLQYSVFDSEFLGSTPNKIPNRAIQTNTENISSQNDVSEQLMNERRISLPGSYDDHQPASVPGSEQLYFGADLHIDQPFGFPSLGAPWNPGSAQQLGNWFSIDFYPNFYETDIEFGLDPFARLSDQEILPTDVETLHPDCGIALHGGMGDDTGNPAHNSIRTYEDLRGDESRNELSGRNTRFSTPPDEVTHENQSLFDKDLNSRPVRKTHAISLNAEDPQTENHNPRFDVTESSRKAIEAFLQPRGRLPVSSAKEIFTLPSLAVVNCFLGLFFDRFLPQAPVLHKPTVDTNKSLPIPLLAIMTVIGAMYSRLPHARRFCIEGLDRTRQNLQLAIENDNRLMGDPMIIYASGLIIYTGLWCGNKRAFNIAETFRSTVVTYIRRLKYHQKYHKPGNQTSGTDLAGDQLKSSWHQWIDQESQKRLHWFIYTIDCQFPSLLNLPSTIPISEVIMWQCPCDEDFWTAPSARHWRNLLGPAPVPPSPLFAAAAGAIIYPLFRGDMPFWGEEIPSVMLNLNQWSYFLVILAVSTKIFEYSQRLLLVTKLTEGLGGEYIHAHSVNMNVTVSTSNLRKGAEQNLLSTFRNQLLESLNLWKDAYAQNTPRKSCSDPTSLYFHRSSMLLNRLNRIYLEISITDLQDAIGHPSSATTAAAMARLSKWAAGSPERSNALAQETIVGISEITQQSGIDMAFPYSSITLFLCNVVLWVFATVSSESQRQQVKTLSETRGSPGLPQYLLDSLNTTLPVNSPGQTPGKPNFSADRPNSRCEGSVETLPQPDSQQGPKRILEEAAKYLSVFGDWGASLSLALLLHWRSKL